MEASRAAWTRQSSLAHVSNVQRDICQALLHQGHKPLMEHITADGLFSIDIAVSVKGMRVAVEVDGNQHFTSGPPHEPLGTTLARWRSLQNRGWAVVSIRTSVWNSAGSREDKQRILEEALASALERGPGSLVDNMTWGAQLVAPSQAKQVPWTNPKRAMKKWLAFYKRR